MKNYPKARKSDIVVSETREEALVYDLNSNKIYCLNDTCRRVWELCDGTLDADAIGARIDRNATPEYRAEFVNMALAQLEESGLLERNGFTKQQTSRREMMRILGTAGAMSLPLVTAAIAPKAVHAQSTCTPPGTPCPGAPGNCCTTPGTACCGSNCCPPGAVGPCCGSGCPCFAGSQCCNGSCCPPGAIGACCGTGCPCLPGATCCNGSCCGPGQLCFGGVCCFPGTPPCP